MRARGFMPARMAEPPPLTHDVSQGEDAQRMRRK